MARNNMKATEVSSVAVGAITNQFGSDSAANRLLDVWSDETGRVALHVDSGATAAVVVHALWLRYQAFEERHPSGGVVLWVA